MLLKCDFCLNYYIQKSKKQFNLMSCTKVKFIVRTLFILRFMDEKVGVKITWLSINGAQHAWVAKPN